MKAFAEKVASDHGLQIEVTDLQRISPVRCDKEIQEAIKAAITEVGEQVISLPSGAGHDGMQLSDLCPIGMIFVQSKDGISHNPNEFSKREDIEKGAKVLYRTLLKIDED